MTFFEIQKEFNEFEKEQEIVHGYTYKNGVKSKAPNWKIFKREEWLWENRINTQTGEFPKTNSIAEYKKYKLNKSLKKETSLNESWTNLGTNSSTGGYAGIGRINCIAFHPTDVNTFWVGSPSGGIWKTTDGGSNWTILNNNMSVLGVSDIAIPSDYTISNTIYIMTGDRDGGSMWSLSGGQGADNVSQGVYKSTDDGITWVATGLSIAATSNAKMGRLLLASNNTTLYASIYLDGIYKSIDSGISWSKVANISYSYVIDMEFKPGDDNTIYASTVSIYSNVNTYIYRTTDGGSTWAGTAASGFSNINYEFMGPIGSGRIELAVTAADPTYVYAIVAAGSTLYGIYKSTDSGDNFVQVFNGTISGNFLLGYYSDGSVDGGQGKYDLCIAASPSVANTVYIGGVNTWKTTDGGTNWVINNMWTSSTTYNKSAAPVVHADKHALEYQPVSGALFEGNDGGIYKTMNGGTSWTDLSNGLVISQLYRIGVSQTSSTTVLTGLQDNGSKLFSGSWSDVKGGDGMECIVDYSNSNYMYATYVEGQITRSVNGFTNWTTEVDISANIPGGQPTGAWVTPYIIDPNSSSTLYAGYEYVYKTTDRGNNWTTISQSLSSGDKLRSLAIAPSNSLVMYAADKTHMWKTTDGGATNWTSITLPSTSTSVTYIAVHPTDPNTVWITYGGYVDGQKVYESTDGGTSWASVSTGLPNIPIMCVTHDNSVTSKNILFAGTDLGVYAKDGSSDWVEYNTGLPKVVVTELEIFYNSSGADKLRAGTYGRGLWETDILAPLPVELTSFTSNQKDNSVILNWTTATEVNNYGFEIEVSTSSTTNGAMSWSKCGFVEGHGNSNSVKYYSYVDTKAEGGNLKYRLKQIDTDGSFEYSEVISLLFDKTYKYALEQNHPNPFNPTTTLSYTVPNNSKVSVVIYNTLGQKVVELFSGNQNTGKHSVTWNATGFSSGTYFARFTATSLKNNEVFSQVKKLLLIK